MRIRESRLAEESFLWLWYAAVTVQNKKQTQNPRIAWGGIPSCRGLRVAACLDLQSSALTENGENQEGEERKAFVWVRHRIIESC